VVAGSALTLTGQVTDDGLPDNSISQIWTVTASPVNSQSTVQFANASNQATTAIFATAGQYTLRLTADDGSLTSYDELNVAVTAAPVATNLAPLANAGTDKVTTVGSPVTLSGSVSDDGLPSGSTLSSNWTLVSGPGLTQFANDDQAMTSVSFDTAGDYVLQLEVSDGLLQSTDTVQVSVSESATTAIVYRINAGGPQLLDPSGNWQADNNASSLANTGKLWGKAAAITLGSLAGSVPDQLFQTERYDIASNPALAWNLPVIPGDYEVRLYFAEIWPGAQAAGKRVFNMEVEGQTLTDFDIYQRAGSDTAVVEVFTVSSDSELNISFQHVIENPAIKGIEVIKVP